MYLKIVRRVLNYVSLTRDAAVLVAFSGEYRTAGSTVKYRIKIHLILVHVLMLFDFQLE